MARKITFFVVVALVVLNTSGCIPLLIGAAAGGGTAAWLSGKLSQEVAASLDKAIAATRSAMRALKLEITKETRKGSVAQIMGKYTDGKTIWIDLRPVGTKTTKIEVRVGAISDEEAARKILNRIQKYL